jgi:hypothetical protein
VKQWPLHWGAESNERNESKDESKESNESDSEQKARDCIVYIPYQDAMQDTPALFDRLVDMASDIKFLQAKLRCIAEIGHRMQYSVPPRRPVSAVATSTPAAVMSDSKKRDAIDVILEEFLLL